MDHSFSGATGAIRQHQHKLHHLNQQQYQHQQSVRNSLSTSPAHHLHNYLQISPSPTNNSITASASLTPLYNGRRTSPTPSAGLGSVSGYQNQTVSNLYRVQAISVQQHQHHNHNQQPQPPQFIQQQPQQQIHLANFGTASETSFNHSNQARLASNQYPLRQQNSQSQASNIVSHRSQNLVSSRSNQTSNHNQGSTSINYSNNQQFQTPPPSQIGSSPSSQQQNMNKNRFQSQPGQISSSVTNNGVSSANPSGQGQMNNSNSNNGKNTPPQNQSQSQGQVQGQQPQYRIFKRGDSIPGISSPINITAQVTSENGIQIQNENWDNNNAEGTSTTAITTTGTLSEGVDNNKENQTQNQNQTSSVTFTTNSGAQIRTPLSQIGEIARFHSIQVEYRLVKETGPPHAPTFTVLLHLGTEEYTGEGPSIKKAQHAAACEALEKTQLSRPPPKSKPKNKNFSHGGNGTGGGGSGGGGKRPNWALIQLTNLAQELQLPLQFVQQPVQIVDPFRRGEPPSIVSVHVGERIFTGEGNNFNSAKNMAVMIALKAMMKVKQEMDLAKLVQAGNDAEQNMMDAENKSPISIVHEMAMKRSLSVAFDIIQETGPPHMKVFTVKCKVGEELESEGQGPTKQAAKKASSELMIAKLKEIPIHVPASSQGINIKAMQRGLLRAKLSKKKTSTPVVKDLDKQTVSPISRLIQICHIKKLKEPEFILISTGTETNVESFLKQITERDRRMLRKKKPVFTIEVTVGSHTCRGTGPNKKAAKKAAAEAAILALGYGPTEEEEGASITTQDPKENSTVEKNPPKSSNKSEANSKSSGSSGPSVKLAGARQIAPGIIVLKQENSAASTTTSATAAQEMKKVNITASTSISAGTGAGNSSTNSREGIEKLAYLSKLLDISVSYSDFPKKNEYLSVVSLTTNPPHVAHGCGATLEEAQNAAALKILEELSTMDLDSVTAAAEKPGE